MTEEEFRAVRGRMERMREGNRRHQREMRRLAVMYVRAVTDGLTEADRVELDGAEAPSFAAMRERAEASRLEHAARRRRAERETASRERIHGALRDVYGLDAADAWVR
ncbi:hypothetical protein SAMN04489713_104265 [Actinomadura madurae]|uniref:Uncharacterized protein n=1 Tax=Actinomadura madurae TaxID=1993 RepID=A0A1I5ESM4_9ACTN|nr:hypothetical protein [Actinomadura madurae]SFO14514.1 hypothetical protein SAMN04489713_104265 [Actinomadura madurae]